MKCPNCGSTAQVRNILLNTKDEIKTNKSICTAQVRNILLNTKDEIKKTNKYICGCGCVFSVNKQK